MFEVAQRLERAGRYFGDILRRFDTLIADIVDWVYVNNLLDPEISPQLKQPFRIKALGFASFFNRIHRLNHLFTLLNLMLSKPEIAQISRLRWVLEEICKALDLDPDQVLKTPQEMEAEAAQLQAELDRQQAAPGGADPQQAALVQAQIDRLLAEAEKARAQASAVQDDARVKKAKAVFDLRAGGMPAAPRISAPMAGAAG
jgi:hypothetical protein